MERLIIHNDKLNGKCLVISCTENRSVHPLMQATMMAMSGGRPVKVTDYEKVAEFPIDRKVCAMAAADAISRVFNLPISWE